MLTDKPKATPRVLSLPSEPFSRSPLCSYFVALPCVVTTILQIITSHSLSTSASANNLKAQKLSDSVHCHARLWLVDTGQCTHISSNAAAR